MEWKSTQRFLLTRASVGKNAPEASGVYGLCSPGTWIYIGQTSNIRKALLEYLSGQMPYVLQWQPRTFVFELYPPRERVFRQKQLAQYYQHVCNRKVNSALRVVT